MSIDSLSHVNPVTYSDICICLIDVKMYTQWCTKHTALHIFNTMNKYNELINSVINENNNLTKIELVGDCVLILSGLKYDKNPSKNVLDMIGFAFNILRRIDQFKGIFNDNTISLRIGIHIGDICCGIIKYPDKIQAFGSDINITSRLESSCIQEGVHISEKAFGLTNLPMLADLSICYGRTKSLDLKGIGPFNSLYLFENKSNEVLIADDVESICFTLNHTIKKHTSYETCVNTVMKNVLILMYTKIYKNIFLDRFFLNEDIIPELCAFRAWEAENRTEKQHIILISGEHNHNNIDGTIQSFVYKDENFNKNIINCLKYI